MAEVSEHKTNKKNWWNKQGIRNDGSHLVLGELAAAFTKLITLNGDKRQGIMKINVFRKKKWLCSKMILHKAKKKKWKHFHVGSFPEHYDLVARQKRLFFKRDIILFSSKLIVAFQHQRGKNVTNFRFPLLVCQMSQSKLEKWKRFQNVNLDVPLKSKRETLLQSCVSNFWNNRDNSVKGGYRSFLFSNQLADN